MNKASKGWLWGTVVGTVVGSVTALLFAPKPGKELRQDIAEGARVAKEKTQEVAERIGEQSSQIAGKVKETTEGLILNFQNLKICKETEELEPEVQVSAFVEEAGFFDTEDGERKPIRTAEEDVKTKDL